ncbi:hypothetical protein QAD02_001841 [Eretmocerus hayati]|uniref:Uncharacterized protein n=1 Tax=Eretmocerus hayati TaxID=131215 RepID=A0ACC2NHK1_9HYME|nr:hypothetical protein QAD02_001841 [Eretmocerus hayati]
MTSRFVFLRSTDFLSTIPQYYTFFLAFIVLWITWYFAKKRNPPANDIDTGELNRKLEEWRPEPLVPEIDKDHASLSTRKITSKVGKKIVVDGQNCLNLGTHNYLGLADDPELERKGLEAIQKYGVGSCGPRGFYGTVDVHLELEERLAQFMQMEEAILYSYGFSAIASAIPAYCKRKDLVFVDEKVNFAIQKGLDASKSQIKYFKHNDVQDLESLLTLQPELNKMNSKNIEMTRKFLIVEGIYMNTGTICPLPDMVALCRKYKLRIFVDESISFGTLGKTGKGVTEHFGVPRHEIDMIMGSLEWSVGSIGGFCVGSSFVIEHQRLSGLGYCFSASLPPLLASAAIASLDIIEKKPELIQILAKNCYVFDQEIRDIKDLDCLSAAESPVKHLYLKGNHDRAYEAELLKMISDKCFESELSLIMPAYLPAERDCPRPSLRMCISASLSECDIKFVIKTLKNCVTNTLLLSTKET